MSAPNFGCPRCHSPSLLLHVYRCAAPCPSLYLRPTSPSLSLVSIDQSCTSMSASSSSLYLLPSRFHRCPLLYFSQYLFPLLRPHHARPECNAHWPPLLLLLLPHNHTPQDRRRTRATTRSPPPRSTTDTRTRNTWLTGFAAGAAPTSKGASQRSLSSCPLVPSRSAS